MLRLGSNGSVPGVVPHMQLGTWCAHPLLLSCSLPAFLTVACQPKIKLNLRGTLIEMFIECLSLSRCFFSHFLSLSCILVLSCVNMCAA